MRTLTTNRVLVPRVFMSTSSSSVTDVRKEKHGLDHYGSENIQVKIFFYLIFFVKLKLMWVFVICFGILLFFDFGWLLHCLWYFDELLIVLERKLVFKGCLGLHIIKCNAKFEVVG